MIDRPAQYSAFPIWARIYRAYNSYVPNHRGKATLLRALHRIGLAAGCPFVWRMHNGTLLAIDPTEGFAPWSVGWTCFESGKWETHVETWLRKLTSPGSTVLDIGANIGYFSAVVSSCAGPNGNVYSFEPVPKTFAQLRLCKALNKFANLTPLNFALGSANGLTTIRFNPAMMGSASLHHDNEDATLASVDVIVRTLDQFATEHSVGEVDLIKMDVEGHEHEVLIGGRTTIARTRPHIIFEYNKEKSDLAGWDLNDIRAVLESAGPYSYYLIHPDARLEAFRDTGKVRDSGSQYVDLLATCKPL